MSEKLQAGNGKPLFIRELPRIKELQAAKRVACRGLPCSQVRIVNDSGARLWLTNTHPFPAQGPLIVSLDENSARHSVNIFLMAMTLE